MKLLVIENIMLQPAMDVYILPFCTVHYTVERKKQVVLGLLCVQTDWILVVFPAGQDRGCCHAIGAVLSGVDQHNCCLIGRSDFKCHWVGDWGH